MEDTYIDTTESAGLEYGYDGGIGTPMPDHPIGHDGGIGADQQQYSSTDPLAPSAPTMNQEPPLHHVLASSVLNAMRMNQNPPQHAMGTNQKPPPQAMGMNQKPPQHGQQPVMGSPVQQYMHLLGGQHQRSPVDMARIGKPWSSGLFDCGKDETNAVMTAFFPCVTFGQISEMLDEGETSCTLGSFMYMAMAPALLTCWILGSNYRTKLRKRYNLVEAPAEDWTVHLFCSCCALCQEFRELQNQGIDPALGWMGFLAQQQQTITTPPNGQFMTQ